MAPTFPKLSIITICLNDCAGLEKTISSVFNQSFRDYEHLVIDGGSVDGSADLLLQHKEKLAYSVSEKDTGRYNAMNKGIAKAQGEYCLFLNSGDYLADDHVLANVFGQHQKEDIVYGDLLFLETDGQKTLFKQPSHITMDYMMRVTLLHPASFIKRHLFEQYGYYDESFKMGADYDFFLKTVIYHQVTTKYVPFAISVFNKEGISTDAKYVELDLEERKKAQLHHLPKIVFDFYHELQPIRESYEFKMMRKLQEMRWLRLIQKVFYKVIEKLT